jgi:hypothetical protein
MLSKKARTKRKEKIFYPHLFFLECSSIKIELTIPAMIE